MARIIMVRHGETEWNRQMRVQGGKSDIPLNDYGREQAKRAGRALEKENFTAVYSSPLSRAYETAQIIVKPHNLEITTMEELVEINAGSYEGIPVSELGKRFSQIIAEMQNGDEFRRPPGGESISDVQKRGWEAIQTIAGRHEEETVLVVTHYFIILTVVCTALEMPLKNVSRFWMSNGSISTLSLDGSVPRLEMFNSPCR